MTEPNDESHWRIDKRIPISLILTIVGQTVGIIIWVVSLNGRVGDLEKNSATSVQYAILNEKFNNVSADIASLKTDISGLKDDVRRVTIRVK